jgi:hypothetical protein
VRVEEKQIIGAIGTAGFVAVPVPPASTPLPPGPASSGGSMLGDLLGASINGERMALMALVDRSSNRSVAAATLPMLRAAGVATIDAGIAATGSRIDIASALIGRRYCPASHTGRILRGNLHGRRQSARYPAVMLGLQPGSSTTVLLDADTADAVIEHRVVLGSESEAIVLMQAGAPARSSAPSFISSADEPSPSVVPCLGFAPFPWPKPPPAHCMRRWWQSKLP